MQAPSPSQNRSLTRRALPSISLQSPFGAVGYAVAAAVAQLGVDLDDLAFHGFSYLCRQYRLARLWTALTWVKDFPIIFPWTSTPS